MTDYDRDPEAIAWARAKVQREVDRMLDFERQDKERGGDGLKWRRIANLLRREFLGTDNCVIAAFDERLPEFRAMLDTAEELT